MNASFSLGTFRGIPVGMNWSVLLIAGLLAFLLATQILPGQVPGLAEAAYWGAGIVSAVLFFASLLGHELAHAVVARREGLRVEGITLWLLGGVARMSGDAPSPGAEARISGVGPLSSFLFALIFAVAAVALGAVGGGELVALASAAAAWLAFVNVILAAFNLLPGVPLDGGRIARSIIWRWRGDKQLATRWATRLGQGLGYVLAGIGFFRVISGDIGGLWFMLIGFFLSSSAGAERTHSETFAALEGVRVGDVMTNDLPIVPGTLTVETFISAALLENRASTWLVAGPGGVTEGIVSIDQLRGHRGIDGRTMRVGELAVPADTLAAAYPDELLTELLGRIEGGQPPRAVVRRRADPSGEILGIVTPERVSRAIQLAQLRAQGGSNGPTTVEADPHHWQQRP